MAKKKIKVRDLKPKKDAKGGSPKPLGVTPSGTNKLAAGNLAPSHLAAGNLAPSHLGTSH